MQLSTLSITNFQIIGAADVNLAATPLHLFAGDNEQGKSSVAEAVRYAMLGEPTRVTKKSEFKELIRDGAKSGAVSLHIDGLENSIELPKGTIVDSANTRDNPMLKFVLSPELFTRLDEAARRAMLFKLTGISVNTEEIRARLTRRKCDPAKIELALPMVRSGFDAANKEAKEKQSEARGAWKNITGETYGAVKAENWQAEKLEFDASQIEALEAECHSTQTALNNAHQEIGALNAGKLAHENAKLKRESLNAKAENAETLAEILVAKKAEYNEQLQEYEALSQKAGSPPTYTPVPCPHCAGLLAVQNGNVSAHVAPEYDPIAAEALPEAKKRIAALQSEIQKIEAQEREALSAKQALESMAETKAIDQGDIDTAQHNIATLSAKLEDVKARLDAELKKQTAALTADDKTASAAQHHKDVEEWGAIADAFAPDGIPSELLADALKPVNARLMQTAGATGWKQVMIRPDMSILVDGRNFGLISESAKWRTEASIAEAISFIAGLNILMLDRIDVLAPKHRPSLLLWLNALAENGEINTALLFGTFKDKPSGLPATISTYWLVNGEIQ